MLVDLKIARHAGGLVRVTRTHADRAEGHFDQTYAAFMDLRNQPGVPSRDTTWANAETAAVHRGTTTVDPRTPWNSLVVWFLAAFSLGPHIGLGYSLTDPTQPPTAVNISTPDGSRARINLDTVAGRHRVTEHGPRRLWRMVEAAQQSWDAFGRPQWGRFGLTVTPSEQHVWLDNSDSPHRWRMMV